MTDVTDEPIAQTSEPSRRPSGSQVLGLVVLVIALAIAVFVIAGDWYADPAGPTAFPSPPASPTITPEPASPSPMGPERPTIGSGVGVEWTALVTFAGASVSDVTAGGPGWIAVGAEGAVGCEVCPSIETYTGMIWSSVDGQTWNEVELPSPQGTNLAHVVSGPSGLVALGWHDTDPVAGQDIVASHVLVSEDGGAWTRVDPPAFAVTGTVISDIAAGQLFVAAGQVADPVLGVRPVIWTSLNGREWTEAYRSPDGGSIHRVAEGGPGWVAVGEVYGSDPSGVRSFVPFPVLWISGDGVTWVQQDFPLGTDAGGGSAQDVLDASLGLVAVGYAETVSVEPAGTILGFAGWRSRDGDTWEPAPVTPDFLENIGGGHLLYEAGGRVFAIGSGCLCGTGWPGRWWTTPDGLAWTQHRETPPILYSVIPFDGGLLGVGLVDGEGAIVLSE
jgi:hypothetical protein